MDRSQQDPFVDLRGNTIAWIAVVIWLVWGYLGQTPPGGPYTQTIRGIFEAILAVVIPLVSLFIVAAWVVALRERRRERANP
jgi:quinol-cytochrome oxidoreductase complex cytochrome b subunit